MRKAILFSGGFVNLILAAFHVTFWDLLNWQQELPKLSIDNQAIMQTANIVAIFTLLYFSIMSFIIIKYEKLDIFAKSIILFIIGFYAIRLIAGYPLFGFSLEELLIWIVCALLIAAYASILVMKKKG